VHFRPGSFDFKNILLSAWSELLLIFLVFINVFNYMQLHMYFPFIIIIFVFSHDNTDWWRIRASWPSLNFNSMLVRIRLESVFDTDSSNPKTLAHLKSGKKGLQKWLSRYFLPRLSLNPWKYWFSRDLAQFTMENPVHFKHKPIFAKNPATPQIWIGKWRTWHLIMTCVVLSSKMGRFPLKQHSRNW